MKPPCGLRSKARWYIPREAFSSRSEGSFCPQGQRGWNFTRIVKLGFVERAHIGNERADIWRVVDAVRLLQAREHGQRATVQLTCGGDVLFGGELVKAGSCRSVFLARLKEIGSADQFDAGFEAREVREFLEGVELDLVGGSEKNAVEISDAGPTLIEPVSHAVSRYLNESTGRLRMIAVFDDPAVAVD